MKVLDVKQVRVGGFDVAVENRTEQLQYQGLIGCFMGRESIIGISKAVSEALQAQALLHEVCHAIESTYLEGDELSERQLSALSQGLFQVLRDNLDFVRAVTGRDDA